ncbi:hypothetical protein [Parasitella parasitica]|uniref:Uncharacterized protein n=1 Tax=Parasitella parasitica TaxID=35722 RepID=A0A0B7N434_9FUNG|nr:hypothetical protein [Parasitella parasitica]
MTKDVVNTCVTPRERLKAFRMTVREMHAQLHKLKSPTPESTPTTISIGNYCVHQGEGDLIVNNSSEVPHKKKQKASTELEDTIENTGSLAEHKAECRFVKRIFLVVANVVNKSPSMTHLEATFNYKMLHPCLEAIINLLCHQSHLGPYYVPGEEPLEAMINQLVLAGSKVDRRKVYNADGIIRPSNFYDIKVLLLERAGHFQNKDTRKICFDNSKGVFALLAMLKSTADHFNRATPETFRDLKLYFVQAR